MLMDPKKVKLIEIETGSKIRRNLYLNDWMYTNIPSWLQCFLLHYIIDCRITPLYLIHM